MIDISVQDLSVYEGVYLSSVKIDTQDTYVDNGPSEHPVFTATSINDKNYRVELAKGDFTPALNDVTKTLFFVYITTVDTSNDNTTQTIVTVVYDTQVVAIMGLNQLNELADECKIPKSLIDFILKQKALELAIETGNFIKAIKYWNSFLKNATVKPCTTGCCPCSIKHHDNTPHCTTGCCSCR